MFWRKNGRLIGKNGRLLDCDHCPCDEVCPQCKGKCRFFGVVIRCNPGSRLFDKSDMERAIAYTQTIDPEEVVAIADYATKEDIDRWGWCPTPSVSHLVFEQGQIVPFSESEDYVVATSALQYGILYAVKYRQVKDGVYVYETDGPRKYDNAVIHTGYSALDAVGVDYRMGPYGDPDIGDWWFRMANLVPFGTVFSQWGGNLPTEEEWTELRHVTTTIAPDECSCMGNNVIDCDDDDDEFE